MKKEKLKFQKKPVIVEAYQTDVEITIDTLEGKVINSIIIGSSGASVTTPFSLYFLRTLMACWIKESIFFN